MKTTTDRQSTKVATAVELSHNRKIGIVSATYVSQDSCPNTCPFKNSGCYAESGLTAITTRRLNRASEELKASPEYLATQEALAINTLTGKLPLRLHVVGDSTTNNAARIVSTAADNYRTKHGSPVWTYTHAHNTDRSSWGKVSVLRSCETIEQVKKADADGFASALVVGQPHIGHKAVNLGDGYKGIPCPQQVGTKASCTDCRLCWQDDLLRRRKMVILFAPDGLTGKKIRQALPMA